MYEGFGVYIHWPFCLSKCPYCDFNSYAIGTKNTDGLEGAYLAQLEHFACLTAEQTVTSIFFGGGTPSLMNPKTVESIIKTVQKLWKTAPDIEISMEANPATVNDFSKFYNAGINRLSIGVQALNDEALKFLGRKHNLKEALQAIENAKKVFSNVSIDLIYARPEQSLDDWKQELEQALTFDINHMSLYQLSIEKGTPFHQRKNLKLPDEDTAAEMFEMTQNMTDSVGLPAYEISNHGKECKHNMTYWLGGDYAGVGAGAHSRITQNRSLTITAWTQENQPQKWAQNVKNGIYGEIIELSSSERIEELILMGLRLTKGIDKKIFLRLAGVSLENAVNKDAFDKLCDADLLENNETFLRVTARGKLLLNTIIEKLLI